MFARGNGGRRSKLGGRLATALLFVGLLMGGGWALDAWMTADNPAVVPLAGQIGAGTELDKVFAAAVEAMQQRDYRRALDLWHRALLLDASIPEIKVNMGFTLYELGQFDTAREFFIDAMEQNAYQANAYYGLALTSEKMGDLSGAMGAMRSYIHLAAGEHEQRFVRRARAALWEWEAELAAAADEAAK